MYVLGFLDDTILTKKSTFATLAVNSFFFFKHLNFMILLLTLLPSTKPVTIIMVSVFSCQIILHMSFTVAEVGPI